MAPPRALGALAGRLRRRRRDDLPRSPPARRGRRRRSPSSTTGVIRIWPGALLRLRRRARAGARAPAAASRSRSSKEIARLEEAVRRFRHWAHIPVNKRAAKQARVKQMQIDRMEKVERPVFERRRMALALRSGSRGGQRVLALEGVDVSLRRRSGPARRRARRQARRARRRRRPQRRRQDHARCACSPSELAPLRGHALGGRRHHGRLPLARPPGRWRTAHGARRAARRPLAGRGRGRAAADGVPVRLRAGPPPGRLAVRRRAHPARVPAV